jgi:integrase
LIGEGNAGYAFARIKRERRGFVTESTPFRSVSEYPERLPRIMARLCKKLGISPPVRPHDLRRSAATWLGELGYTDQAIGRILGHTDRGVIKTYNRYSYDNENKAAWGALAERIMAIVRGEEPASNVVALR